MLNEQYERACKAKEGIAIWEQRMIVFNGDKMPYEDYFPEACAEFKSNILRLMNDRKMALVVEFSGI